MFIRSTSKILGSRIFHNLYLYLFIVYYPWLYDGFWILQPTCQPAREPNSHKRGPLSVFYDHPLSPFSPDCLKLWKGFQVLGLDP